MPLLQQQPQALLQRLLLLLCRVRRSGRKREASEEEEGRRGASEDETWMSEEDVSTASRRRLLSKESLLLSAGQGKRVTLISKQVLGEKREGGRRRERESGKVEHGDGVGSKPGRKEERRPSNKLAAAGLSMEDRRRLPSERI